MTERKSADARAMDAHALAYENRQRALGVGKLNHRGMTLWIRRTMSTGAFMRQLFWVSTCVATIAVVFAVGTVSKINADRVSVAQTYETAYAEPEIGTATQLSLRGAGSAISAAAFGLSALQPETYDGEIVLDIINASPLASRQKLELAAELRAAETGRADLNRVLTDVRVALAIE